MTTGLIPGPDSLEVSVPRNGQILTVSMYATEPDQAEKNLEMILDIMADSQAAYDHAKKRMEKTIEDITIKLADWDIQQTRYGLCFEQPKIQAGIIFKTKILACRYDFEYSGIQKSGEPVPAGQINYVRGRSG